MKNDPVFQAILHVIDYFGFFSYPPSVDEIHTFLSIRISRKELGEKIDDLVHLKVLEAQQKEKVRYCRCNLFKYFDLFKERKVISEYKKKKVSFYVSLLRYLPWIQFVGISGSVAMDNAKKKDDIDLFIITSPGRLWTGRLLAAGIAFLMGIKRNRNDTDVSDKLCLNLFFDGKNLQVPFEKQNEYVGHEVLQMKPLLNKNDTYESFLTNNSWVRRFFPSFRLPKNPKVEFCYRNSLLFGDVLEKIARSLQLWSVTHHQTRELISDTQLWFFPKDFENHIKKHIMIEKKD